MFECKIDLSEYHRKVALSKEAFRIVIQDAVRNAANDGADHARASTAFKDQTGNLRGSIRSDPKKITATSAEWEICSPAKYSIFVEKGTRPHQIWPKAGYGLKGPLRNGQTRRATGKGPHEYIVGRGYALRWVSGGQTFFARYVNHPGTRPTLFFTDAVAAAMDTFYREIGELHDRLERIWS